MVEPESTDVSMLWSLGSAGLRCQDATSATDCFERPVLSSGPRPARAKYNRSSSTPSHSMNACEGPSFFYDILEPHLAFLRIRLERRREAHILEAELLFAAICRRGFRIESRAE